MFKQRFLQWCNIKWTPAKSGYLPEVIYHKEYGLGVNQTLHLRNAAVAGLHATPMDVQRPAALVIQSDYSKTPMSINLILCPTSREDRQIALIAVTDRSVTSRTIAQHIESVTHHSVSALTIRRRLEQSGMSARRPLLGLPLTQKHRCLRHQWCDERRMWVAE
ncbi:transposable element Tcb1 transposase [Trichonephila clavipes]|nr:transposable element Tcb1 transposase [Trichonephila clavipes]